MLIPIALLLLNSCSLTKKLDENEFLLTKNTFEYTSKEKPEKQELKNYVKQKPNRKTLGVLPIELWLYNSSNKKYDLVFDEYNRISEARRNKNTLDSLYKKYGLEDELGNTHWWSRQLFKWGKPPVVVDTALLYSSERTLEDFLQKNGYFDAKVGSNVTYKNNKKATIKYQITPGEPSVIETFQYNIKDQKLKEIYEINYDKKVIDTAKIYHFSDFLKEEQRISETFKNNGYYNFNSNGRQLYFEADTIPTNKKLDITLFIQKQDSTEFKPYYFDQITIYPDSRPNENANSDQFYTQQHNNYIFKFKNPPNHKLDYFTDALSVKPFDIYRVRNEVQTKRNLYQRENFNFTDYQTSIHPEYPDSLLNVDIYLTPKNKYDLNFFFEGSISEYLGLGLSPGISLLTRNIFGGGENLKFTIRSNFGTVTNLSNNNNKLFNAFEIGGQAELQYPYLFLPKSWRNKIKSESINPSSNIKLGLTAQRNIGLGRVNYLTGIDYIINPKKGKQHRLTLFNTQVVRSRDKDRYFQIFDTDFEFYQQGLTQYIAYDPSIQTEIDLGLPSEDDLIFLINNDQGFLASLDAQGQQNIREFQNMSFRRESLTQDSFISSIIYQYTNNQNEQTLKKNPWFFRGQAEFSGNLLSILDNAIGFNTTQTNSGDLSGTIFGIPYAQFVKLDFDVRKYLNFNRYSSLVFRQFVGLALPYGNSDLVPFDRSYFAGGSTDIRAWQAYSLGPGDNNSLGDLNISNFKITWNLEYRFKLFGALNGALFTDVGNIWSVNNDFNTNSFDFSTFWSELAVGSGMGFRYDLSLLIIRLDLGYKLHDPSEIKGNRWRFNNFNPLKPTIQFGINHPF